MWGNVGKVLDLKLVAKMTSSSWLLSDVLALTWNPSTEAFTAVAREYEFVVDPAAANPVEAVANWVKGAKALGEA